MEIYSRYLNPRQEHRLQIVFAVLSLLTFLLIAGAYSKKAHTSNIGRGAFDATTEGPGIVRNVR